MKLGLILLISITGIMLVSLLPQGYSELAADNKYLVQATGFIVGKQEIVNTDLDLQLSLGDSNNGNIPATLENGVLTLSGDGYLNAGTWQASVLRDGRFMVVTGDAQNSNGDSVHLNLFGRLISNSQDGSVYWFSGKISSATETMQAALSAKISSANNLNVTPPTQTPTQTPPTSTPTQTPSQTNTIQISIVAGASIQSNLLHFSPSSIHITPGTTIVWTNNDSVPHRILSGVLSFTTEGSSGSANPKPNAPSYYPDGKIDSGIIVPGQTFQYTFTGTGTTTVYDPTYTWINGAISAFPSTSAQTVQISIVAGAYQSQGTASQQNNFYYNHYFTPTNLKIVPGTTVVWTNNDSVSHRILSGIKTDKPQNPFTPDGKIDSGDIAPGKTYQITINDVGIIRYYDPSYTWMNDVIVSLPPPSSIIISAPSHNPGLH